MSKYQSIMVMLFSNHPSTHCFKYESNSSPGHLNSMGCHKEGHLRHQEEHCLSWQTIMSRLSPTVSGSARSNKKHTLEMAMRSVNDTTLEDAPWGMTPVCPQLLATQLPWVAPWKAVHQVRVSSEATPPYDTLNSSESCLLTQTRPGLHGYSVLSRREFPLDTSVPTRWYRVSRNHQRMRRGPYPWPLWRTPLPQPQVLGCGHCSEKEWQMVDDLPTFYPQRTEHQWLHRSKLIHPALRFSGWCYLMHRKDRQGSPHGQTRFEAGMVPED